ncbi:MAG: hypothetical protein U0638_15905 [Phycisphaerales bacterium]
MGLIACPDCGNQVSAAATACPKCGRPTATAPGDVVAKPVAGYSPRPPRLAIRPFGFLIGAALLGAGLFVALVWVPSHDPRKVDTVPKLFSAMDKPGRYMKEDEADLFLLAGWALAVLGGTQLAVGTVRRDGVIRFCKNCNMQVNTTKRMFRLRCERCGGRVQK